MCCDAPTPVPPDYKAAAESTTASNLALLEQQTKNNRPDQNTPWGNSSWTKDAGGNWTQNLLLKPAEQDQLDAQRSLQLSQTNTATGLLGRINNNLSRAPDYSNLPPLQGLNSNYSGGSPSQPATPQGRGINQGQDGYQGQAVPRSPVYGSDTSKFSGGRQVLGAFISPSTGNQYTWDQNGTQTDTGAKDPVRPNTNAGPTPNTIPTGQVLGSFISPSTGNVVTWDQNGTQSDTGSKPSQGYVAGPSGNSASAAAAVTANPYSAWDKYFSRPTGSTQANATGDWSNVAQGNPSGGGGPTVVGGGRTSGVNVTPGQNIMDPGFGAVQGVQDAIMARLRPDREQAREGELQRLRNQGLGENTEAYRRSMTRMDRGDTDASQQALLAATGAYGDIFNRGSTNNKQINANNSLANANLNAGFYRDLGAGNFNAAIRQQGIAEAEMTRQSPLNDLMRLRGQNVINPSLPSFAQAGNTAGTDYTGAARAGYGGSLDVYNAQQGAANSQTQGLFGLAGAGLSAYSSYSAAAAAAAAAAGGGAAAGGSSALAALALL